MPSDVVPLWVSLRFLGIQSFREPIEICPSNGSQYHFLDCGHLIKTESFEPCGANCKGCDVIPAFERFQQFACDECIKEEMRCLEGHLIEEFQQHRGPPFALGSIDYLQHSLHIIDIWDKVADERVRLYSSGRHCELVTPQNIRDKEVDYSATSDKFKTRAELELEGFGNMSLAENPEVELEGFERLSLAEQDGDSKEHESKEA